MVNIIFLAGGTGGHLFPAIATMMELQKQNHKVHLITDQRCSIYLKNYPNIPYSIYYSVSLDGGVVKKIIALLATLLGVIRALIFYLYFKPSKIVAFGGYTMFAGSYAAIIMRIELILHEQNIVIGRANAFFLQYAKKIALTFDETMNLPIQDKAKAKLVGSPRRPLSISIQNVNDVNLFHVLIIGGSQGAKIFSQVIPEALKVIKYNNPNLALKITQQARAEDIAGLKKLYEAMGVDFNIQQFFTNIDELYLASSLVISRAGSGSIVDLIETNSLGILIPLPSSAGQHQLIQAQFLSKQNAALCILQDDFLVQNLIKNIQYLLDDTKLQVLYKNNIAKLKKDATSNFCKLILQN